MKSYIAFMDGLPWVVKLILTFFFGFLTWGVYRIVKGVMKKNVLLIVVGILCIPLSVITNIVDFISVLIYKKPVLFVD